MTGTLRRGAATTASIVSVLVLVISGWMHLFHSGTHVTAYFSESVGLFPGSDVRVLGMRVGSVSDVAPQGTKVRVDMQLDPGTKVPAGARAVAVAPSLVSDRYVQFTPVYEGGPQLQDGAVIPRERTGTPLELDEINRNTDRMITALGPNGANKHGALADSLNVSAQNLKGNGEQLNQTIAQLGQAARSLSDSRGDLFSTVDNLDKFTTMLANSDQQVHQLNTQLSDATGFLASQRSELGGAMRDLGPALEDVQGFLRQNRDQVKSNVDHLRGVTQALVDQRAALAEVLDVSPLGLSNLSNTYDAASGSLQTRGNPNELTNPPIVIVCKLLQQATPAKPVPPALAEVCRQLEPVIKGAVPLPSPADAITSLQHGRAPELPLPLVKAINSSVPAGGGR